MNQKQISSNQEPGKNTNQKASFKQTIKKIEFNTFKQEFQRKKLISIRNKLRQEWLDRIKIVPPRLGTADRENFFRATDSFSQKQYDCFKMYRHNHPKQDPFEDDIDLLFQKRTFKLSGQGIELVRQSALQRKSYNHTSTGFHKNRLESIRSRKLKENWKLAYRKDQINVLRFSTGTPKDAKQLKASQINRLLNEMIQPQAKTQPQPKMMYKKIVDFEEDSNKQNIQEREQQKKQEKKFRFNVKKGKTSLILKKQVIM